MERNHKEKGQKKRFSTKPSKERMREYDPLEEVEEETGEEYSTKMHEKAEKPDKFPKKVRSGARESYRPLRRR